MLRCDMIHRASSQSPRRSPPGPLRLRRLALGLLQADVADLAGVSREQVVRLEAGACVPRIDTAARLASALSCGPSDIFPLNKSSPAGEPGLTESRPVETGAYGTG
jgi:transcriptional regulator with XRE-family HTH domain